MAALATRFAGDSHSRPRAHAPIVEPIIASLGAEFLTVPDEVVDRCVADVWACAEHLGVDVTPALVERIARERLLAKVNSSPPSRR
jgi:hypothetical protein